MLVYKSGDFDFISDNNSHFANEITWYSKTILRFKLIKNGRINVLIEYHEPIKPTLAIKSGMLYRRILCFMIVNRENMNSLCTILSSNHPFLKTK